jgi:bacteriocin-like protein
MDTNITELNTEDLQTIQGGRVFASGSKILGYTTPVDPQLQQLDWVSSADFIRNIYP